MELPKVALRVEIVEVVLEIVEVEIMEVEIVVD